MGWEQGGSRMKGMECVIIAVEFMGNVWECVIFSFLLDSLLVLFLSLFFVLLVLDLSFSFSSVGASTRLKRASPKRRIQISKLKYKITSYCARCFHLFFCQRRAVHVFMRTFDDACEFCWGPYTMRVSFAADLWRCVGVLLRTFHVLLRTSDDASDFCWGPFTMRLSFA